MTAEHRKPTREERARFWLDASSRATTPEGRLRAIQIVLAAVEDMHEAAAAALPRTTAEIPTPGGK